MASSCRVKRNEAGGLYVGLVNDHARFCFRYKELKGMM